MREAAVNADAGRILDFLDALISLGGDQEELPNSERCIEALRALHSRLAAEYSGPIELFEPIDALRLEGPATFERKLQHLFQTSVLLSLALQREFRIKLLYVIEAYITAVESKNPVSTFLIAR